MPIRCPHNFPSARYVASRGEKGRRMTEVTDTEISEAVSVIDKALARMLSRELVSSVEVTDVLLDVRSLLTLPAPAEH